MKVFVTDCDGTLWEGVVSEDGADSLRFTEAHLMLQRLLSRLQRSGRLICVSSKNSRLRRNAMLAYADVC